MWLAHWSTEDVAAHETRIIKQLAFVTRYTSTSLSEALACDSHWLGLFAQAVAEIIRGENAAGTSRE